MEDRKLLVDTFAFHGGCTFGKGNIEKTGEGRLALTLVDKAANRKVRVAYRPTLQPRIKASTFMRQRTAGVPADQIPDADQRELVDLLWEAPEGDVLTVGDVVPAAWLEPEEVARFAVGLGCGELVAEPYLRVVAGEQGCLACSGYLH